MTFLRPGLPPVPINMKLRPLSKEGWPIPFFVSWKVVGKIEREGKLPLLTKEPDFGKADQERLRECVGFGLCWCCGGVLGRHVAFLIGPMAVLDGISAEPPSHIECAEFVVQATPFMLGPTADKRPTAVWVTKKYNAMQFTDGLLFNIGENPERVFWYAEGERTSRYRVQVAIEKGIPALRDSCKDEKERNGLNVKILRSNRFLPSF